MIDFSLSEEQQALRDLARDFAQREIAPLAAELDREQRYPQEIVERYFELGLLHYGVPKEYGGGGLGSLEGCLVAEELAAGSGGVEVGLYGNILGLLPLLIAGSDELKEELLPRHCSGPNQSALCVTEAGAGSDVGSIRTRACRDGGEYVIDGTKRFITNGGVASLYTVIAKEDPDLGNRGLSAFVVPADTPGLSHGRKEDKLGQRSSDTCEVIFEEVRIPARYLLGRGRDGFKITMRTLDSSRPVVGSQAVGICRAALEAAVAYVNQSTASRQGGKPPQGTQLMLADMAIKVQAARWLCWHAAWLGDHGHRNTQQSAMAKCFAGDIAVEVTSAAVQLLGVDGYTARYPVERYLRDARAYSIFEGTAEIQRLVIARELLL
ncbi:MAG TPA: acyl-CoA dehydrogenase family protein [Anaerolineae bacterium]|nr:acyl-CoA dehydrogenase family protein [Anaerolineae bacterium]